MRVAIFFAAMVFGFAAIGQERYASEWIQDNDFIAAYDILIDDSKLPEWAVKMLGPSSPSTMKKVRSVEYIVIQMCKAHDCGTKNLTVFYNPLGESYGLFNGDTAIYLGCPDDHTKISLLESHLETYRYSGVKEKLQDDAYHQ